MIVKLKNLAKLKKRKKHFSKNKCLAAVVALLGTGNTLQVDELVICDPLDKAFAVDIIPVKKKNIKVYSNKNRYYDNKLYLLLDNHELYLFFNNSTVRLIHSEYSISKGNKK